MIKIGVYQPRVSEPVAPVVQETGANIWPGISALAQGASQATQAVMMKIKEIEIETQTEEGIVAQSNASLEFLDAMKKNPIYPAMDENGKLPGYPDINPKKEDGEYKDREELHAEVLEKYFQDTDSQINDQPLNPRARENIQNWWNRQKVQIADQVRDQMIADDLATLRQRQMDLLKSFQEAGNVQGADLLTKEGMHNGFFTEAQRIALDNQTRIMAAESISMEIASTVMEDAFRTAPASALSQGIDAVDSEELAQVLKDQGLDGYYNAATKQKVKAEVRRQYQEQVNAGMRLVSESSVEFRKRIHEITALTDIPALRDAIIDDQRLSFFADEWREQERLLRLLDIREDILSGRGSGKKRIIDPELLEIAYRKDAGRETIEAAILDYRDEKLAEYAETMTPGQLALAEYELNENIDFALKMVRNQDASNNPQGDAYEIVDSLVDDLLKDTKDPRERQLLRARGDNVKSVLVQLHNDLWYQKVPPETIYKHLQSTTATLMSLPLRIQSKSQFRRFTQDLAGGEMGTAFVAQEFMGEAKTDADRILQDIMLEQGIIGIPDTTEIEPWDREEDGEVFSGEVMIKPGELDGELEWFMVDPSGGRGIKLKIYDQEQKDWKPYVTQSTPRERIELSSERNAENRVRNTLDHLVGVMPVSEVLAQIKNDGSKLSDDEIYNQIYESYKRKLKLNIKNDMKEYRDTTNPRSERNRARKALLPENIKFNINMYVGERYIDRLYDEVADEYSLDYWLDNNPKIRLFNRDIPDEEGIRANDRGMVQ